MFWINTDDSLFLDVDKLVSGLWESQFFPSPGLCNFQGGLRCIGIVCLFFGGHAWYKKPEGLVVDWKTVASGSPLDQQSIEPYWMCLHWHH